MSAEVEVGEVRDLVATMTQRQEEFVVMTQVVVVEEEGETVAEKVLWCWKVEVLVPIEMVEISASAPELDQSQSLREGSCRGRG